MLIRIQEVWGRAREGISKPRGLPCCWLVDPAVRSTAVEVLWFPMKGWCFLRIKCPGDLEHLRANHLGANYTDSLSCDGLRTV